MRQSSDIFVSGKTGQATVFSTTDPACGADCGNHRLGQTIQAGFVAVGGAAAASAGLAGLVSGSGPMDNADKSDRMGLQLLVAVDENWGIGYQDALQFRIKADLHRFKTMTMGRCVILGRRTLQTFPGQRPLTGRTNIILTRQPGFQADTAVICHDLPGLARAIASFSPADCFVIGGASIYQLLLPYCQTAHVTRVRGQFPADRFFPDLDHHRGWRLVACGSPEQEDGLTYQFLRYENDAYLSLESDPCV